MIEGDGFRAPTLAELLSADRGQVFIERRSAGCFVPDGVVEYRSADRAPWRGPRPMTVTELRRRLAALEDRLKLEPGSLTD